MGKTGTLGPWSRVIVYCSKLSFCQNDSPIGGSVWQKDSLLQFTMTLLQGPRDPVLPILFYITNVYILGQFNYLVTYVCDISSWLIAVIGHLILDLKCVYTKTSKRTSLIFLIKYLLSKASTVANNSMGVRVANVVADHNDLLTQWRPT